MEKGCLGSATGEKLGEYASVPMPSCKDCNLDKNIAEGKCRGAIDAMANANIGKLIAPLVVKSGVDSAVALVSAKSGALPVSLLATLDGVVGAACTIQSVNNIKKSAATAKSKYCNCPKEKE